MNGNTVRYIEYLDWECCLDSFRTIDSYTPTDTFGGLSHLEGKVVSVIADGIYIGQETVESGSITIPVDAYRVQVGLPYTQKLVTARVEGDAGTIQGATKRWVKCSARVFETKDITINDQPQDTAMAVTDDLDVVNLGYDTQGRISIVQDKPYRATILSIFGVLSVGD